MMGWNFKLNQRFTIKRLYTMLFHVKIPIQIVSSGASAAYAMYCTV